MAEIGPQATNVAVQLCIQLSRQKQCQPCKSCRDNIKYIEYNQFLLKKGYKFNLVIFQIYITAHTAEHYHSTKLNDCWLSFGKTT